MLGHNLRGGLHQIIRRNSHGIPRHDLPYGLPQNPPGRLSVLHLPQRDQPALFPGQKIERADESHEPQLHPAGAVPVGILESFDDRRARDSHRQKSGDGFVYGGLGGEREGILGHEIRYDFDVRFGGRGDEDSTLGGGVAVGGGEGGAWSEEGGEDCQQGC